MQYGDAMATRYYAASEAARELGISLDTLRRWDRSGKIRVRRDSANRRVVPASEVGKIAKGPRPKGNGSRVDTLKGGDYVRVWIAKGGNNYIINMPPAT